MNGAQRLNENVDQRCTWDDFLRETLRFAFYQVRRRLWRHDGLGVLPAGYEPSSIAAQAILEFLQQHPVFNSAAFPTDPADGEFIAALDSHSRQAIQYELNRLVLKQVNRLYHLKENFIVDQLDEFVPVQDMDGDYVNPIDLIPAPDLRPDEALLKKESILESEQIKRAFESGLSNRPLIKLFRLGYDGILQPSEIADRLKLPVRTIYNLREQLQRAWSRFARQIQN